MLQKRLRQKNMTKDEYLVKQLRLVYSGNDLPGKPCLYNQFLKKIGHKNSEFLRIWKLMKNDYVQLKLF